MKIQKTVKDETKRIAIGTAVLSVVMMLIFILIKKFDMAVIFGTILGSGFAVLNFFVLGLGIQKATMYGDEKRARSVIQLSYSLRSFAMIAVCIIGFVVPIFNWVCVVAPMFFPRIVIAFITAQNIKNNNAKISDNVIDIKKEEE